MGLSKQDMEWLNYTQPKINQIIQTMDHFTIPLNKATEGDTCAHFILPFFQAFGWGSGSYTHWHAEHRIPNTSQHVDYAFSQTGNGWAYIEAKRILYKNIDKNPTFVKQIKKYFNEVPDAHLIILTNGEEYCFYSYGDNDDVSTTPFIKFKIREINLTGNATFLRYLAAGKFRIGDWPKYAEMSRFLAEIQHSLRRAPDTSTKRRLIEASFSLLYPNMNPDERNEAFQFFMRFGQR